MTEFQVINERTWRSRQTQHCEVIERLGATKRRLYVHCDAYEFQSYARAERWDGNAWQEVYRIPGECLASLARGCFTDDVADDLTELRRVFDQVVLS